MKSAFDEVQLRHQQHFKFMEEECINAEAVVTSLEQSCRKLEDKLYRLEGKLERQKLTEIRKQQDEFIISELQARVGRLTKN